MSDWRDTLPEDLKALPAAQKFNTPDDLLKSYVELEKLQGSSVRIPAKDAKLEEITAFRTKIGVPAKVEDYKLTELKDLHPSVKVTPEGQRALLEIAHKAGVTGEAADTLNQWFLKQVSDAAAAREKADTDALAAASDTLKKEWGAKYDEKLAAANKFAQALGGKEAAEIFGDLGKNPKLLQFLEKASSLISEDAIKNLNAGGGGGGSDDPKAAAKKEIESIINLPTAERNKHPYFNDGDPKHHDEVQRVKKLYDVAYKD